ncbi:MAG: hypothetical protein E8D45_09280 [Nitrospira sp.]|nr:MAG: hypothetical protein E8D45_09280 [Nitrospira sp.]
MNPARSRVNNERGVALMAALLVTFILAVLGSLSLQLAAQETISVRGSQDEAASRYLAQAATDVVMQWFHEPGAVPTAEISTLVAKRISVPDGTMSFFDAKGVSQFVGTAERPDLFFDAGRADHDRLLNDPAQGWFRSLRGLGRILTLKAYGPLRPGALCTVEVTAQAGPTRSTLSVELGVRQIPPVRAGVQLGGQGVDPVLGGLPVPVGGHWGDITLKGSVNLGKSNEVPLKTDLAPITGQSYGEMSRAQDRWTTYWIGGEVRFSDGAAALPLNVVPKRDPVPGLREDIWGYDALKRQAQEVGTYYAMDRSGLLYRDGVIEIGTGITADEAFRSDAVGQHRGLVFVDTLDQQAPRGDNLGTLTIQSEYLEGLFVVHAHVQLKPSGPGKTIETLSPPTTGSSMGSRTPVLLSRIMVNGVISTPGTLTYEGAPRIHGAIMVGGAVVKGAGAPAPLEVWYNHDLRKGMVQGMPVVYPIPGSQITKM